MPSLLSCVDYVVLNVLMALRFIADKVSEGLYKYTDSSSASLWLLSPLPCFYYSFFLT